MEIEKVKRKNLEQERKIGKLEGDMDLIRLRGHVDDPKQLEMMSSPTPRTEKPALGSRALGKPRNDRKQRQGKADNTSGWDRSTKLPPLSDSPPPLQRDRSKSLTGKTEHFTDREDQDLKQQIDARLPPISPTGQMTPRSGSDVPTSPGRRNRKQYPALSKERPKDKINTLHKGQPVMGYTETQAMSKMKHIERESSYRSTRENSLKTLDFKGVLSESGTR